MLEILEDRLIALEIKTAYQEDTLNQLDDILINQQNQIDQLNRQVQSLLAHVRELKQRSDTAAGNERPPHY